MKSTFSTCVAETLLSSRRNMLSPLLVLLAPLLFAACANAQSWVYVVTTQQQFGAVDLATGAFHAIGPNTPEGQASLVWGTHGTLFSLTYSGNLESINPATGQTTVVGATGLGFNAFDLAEVGGKLYATDFGNNLYTVDPDTGVATLLRATGIPPDPEIPFSINPDGTINLCDESIYGFAGKLYATFDAFTIDPNSLAETPVVSANVYRINPSTGRATLIAPTTLNLGSSIEVEGKFFAFRWVITSFTTLGPQVTSQLLTLDPASGNTSFVTEIDRNAGGIVGAAPVRRHRSMVSE
jgi:hypothetical protein